MTIATNLIIVLTIIFTISALLNAVLIWYTRVSIQKFSFISENIQDLKDSIAHYENHLKSVYEMEMFYGDETLKSLIEHTRALSGSMSLYDDFYDLFGIEVLEEEIEEEEIEEELADDEAQTQAI